MAGWLAWLKELTAALGWEDQIGVILSGHVATVGPGLYALQKRGVPGENVACKSKQHKRQMDAGWQFAYVIASLRVDIFLLRPFDPIPSSSRARYANSESNVYPFQHSLLMPEICP